MDSPIPVTIVVCYPPFWRCQDRSDSSDRPRLLRFTRGGSDRRTIKVTRLTHTGYLMGRQRLRSPWNGCVARKRKLKGGATALVVRTHPKAPAMRLDDRTAD